MAARMSGMHIVTLIIIAVLTSAFLFTTAFAFFPDPSYNDYCDDRSFPPRMIEECPDTDFNEEQRECFSRGGFLVFEYNDNGCPITAVCDTCNVEYRAAVENAQAYRFYILSALSLMLIIGSLYLVRDDTPILFAVTTGIIVGSLISIMIMSFMTLPAFSTYVRPIIFLFQIILVIMVAVKKFGTGIMVSEAKQKK
ncbi:MAG: hypothetical protein ACMXYL_02370 [Candidatus Woesearchaeota archaeon]